MQTIFCDFETYYDDDYSLRKMTPAEYVLDPRFECIGCAIKEGVDGPNYWVDGPDLPTFFSRLDAGVTQMVTFNALFDMCIVAWRMGMDPLPRLITDAMGMVRACVGHKLKSEALDSVARYFALPPKGDTVHQVKGMTLAAIKANGLYDSYVSYSLHDNVLCAEIYRRLIGTHFPLQQLAWMDMVLRCAIEPAFCLDRGVLAQHLAEIRAKKEALLQQAGATKDSLMSNDSFAEKLRALGIDPPTKTSLTTGKQIYAFAKTDFAMLELAEHDDPDVQALIAARMGHKSTLEETRTERFIKISNLQWPGRDPSAAPLMPLPLRYSGAHTHRLSGDWKINVQNLPRNSTLRRALIAPPGHQIIAADSSQVEARSVAALAGQHDLVALFEAGADVYSAFASKVFGREIDKHQHKTERFVGKQAVLGLGYQLGWRKFQSKLKTDSKLQVGEAISLTDEEAMRVVETYRATYPRIKAAWARLHYEGIPALLHGRGFTFGPVAVEAGSVLLPNGLRLFYHDLRQEGGQWVFTHGGKTKRLYGGKLLENINQALAGIATAEAAMRARMRGFRMHLQVHDELVYVVPNDRVEEAKQVLVEEMRRRPSWLPSLPLACDPPGVGASYGEAK